MRVLLRGLLAVVVAGSFFGANQVSAQSVGTNNPYKQLEVTKPVWPPFYKPDPKDVKYSKMLNDGVCKPTGNRAREYYMSKLVDVNKLPEFLFEGKVTNVADGALTVVDNATGESLIVMIHGGVSRVNVSGKGTPELLTSGTHVQFIGRVDSHGAGTEKVDRIEVITPNLATAAVIEPNKLQRLCGKVVRHVGEQLILLGGTTKRYRLEIELKPEAEVFAHFADYRYSSVGDAVKFKGRILRSTTPGQTFCFADDLDVSASGRLQPPKDAAVSIVASPKPN